MSRLPLAALVMFATLGGLAAPALAASVNVLAGDGFPGYADAAGAKAQFKRPAGVTVDAAGNVYVADRDNYRIRKVDAAGTVTTVAGTGDYGDIDSSFSVPARFKAVADVAVDAAGNLYVSDSGNVIRKVTPEGAASTYVAKDLANPQGLAIDGAGNLYVADTDNNVIKKVDNTGAASVLAGDGNAGNVDGAGKDARFWNPEGVAVDAQGNVYVADTGNHCIRKIDAKGTVTTLAFNGHPPELSRPTRLVVDKANTLFVSDEGLDAIVLIAANGATQRLALTPFSWPGGLAVDPKSGAVVFAIAGRNQVWKLSR